MSTNSFDREFSISREVLERLEVKPLDATPYDKKRADEVLEKACKAKPVGFADASLVSDESNEELLHFKMPLYSDNPALNNEKEFSEALRQESASENQKEVNPNDV